jgi:hypothetical protein
MWGMIGTWRTLSIPSSIAAPGSFLVTWRRLIRLYSTYYLWYILLIALITSSNIFALRCGLILVTIWSPCDKRQNGSNERLESYRHHFNHWWQHNDGLMNCSNPNPISRPCFWYWGLPSILTPLQTLPPGQNKVLSNSAIIWSPTIQNGICYITNLISNNFSTSWAIPNNTCTR